MIPLRNCVGLVKDFLQDYPKDVLENHDGFVQDILKDFFKVLIMNYV